MAKRLNWDRRRRVERSRVTATDVVKQLNNRTHDSVVEMFLKHVRKYEKLGVPAPEFKVPEYYQN